MVTQQGTNPDSTANVYGSRGDAPATPVVGTSPPSEGDATPRAVGPQNQGYQTQHEGRQTDSTGEPPPHPLEALFAQIRETSEYASLYIQAKKDGFNAQIRGLVFRLVLVLMAGFLGVVVLAVAAVYLLSGVAAGVGELLGGRPELGKFLTGLVIFLIVVGGGWLGVQAMFKKFKQRIFKTYDRRYERERLRFGHDVRDRAAEVRKPD